MENFDRSILPEFLGQPIAYQVIIALFALSSASARKRRI